MNASGLYHDLPLGEREIRLLYVTPARDDQPLTARLEVSTLEAKSRYIALSYTWGELNISAAITCNGTPLGITQNLHEALIRMRKAGVEALWVDQICINQEDVAERGQQVSMMRYIFRSASNVYIWLGQHKNATCQAVQIIERLAANEDIQSIFNGDENTIDAKLVSYQKVYQSP